MIILDVNLQCFNFHIKMIYCTNSLLMVLVDARDLQSKRSDIYTSKGGKSLLQPHQESVAGCFYRREQPSQR